MDDLYGRHYPNTDEESWKKSGYYWWYRFMQKVEGYGPDHPLWKDFGDVHQPFMDWWIEHEDIFLPRFGGVAELKTDADIEAARKDGAIIVRVDPEICSWDALQEQFQWVLEDNNIAKPARGRQKHETVAEVGPDRYGFASRPEVRDGLGGLAMCMKVYEERIANPDMSLYDIAVKLKINESTRITDDMLPKQQSDIINNISASVRRYLRDAESIIEHVGQGKFPVLASTKKTSELREVDEDQMI